MIRIFVNAYWYEGGRESKNLINILGGYGYARGTIKKSGAFR